MGLITVLSAVAAANSPPVAVKATGSITCVASANLVHGDHFMLDDGRGQLKFFEFIKSAGVTTLSRTICRYAIDVTAVLTAAQVHTLVIAAVNAAGIEITASDGGGAVVTLTHNLFGPDGNRLVRETVADAGFTITGMSGGLLSGVRIARDREVIDALKVWSTAAGATQDVSGRLWGYWHADPGQWAPMGIGTAAGKGILNGGASFGRTATNNIAHEEPLRGISLPDQIYLELTGTFDSALVSAKLLNRNQLGT